MATAKMISVGLVPYCIQAEGGSTGLAAIATISVSWRSVWAVAQAEQQVAAARVERAEAQAQVQEARQDLLLAGVRLQSLNAEAQFQSGQKFTALLSSLRAAQQFQVLDRSKLNQDGAKPEVAHVKARVTAALYQESYLTELRSLSGHVGRIRSVNFSPDDRTLASGSDDGTVKIWNWNIHKLTQLACERARYYLTVTHPEARGEPPLCEEYY